MSAIQIDRFVRSRVVHMSLHLRFSVDLSCAAIVRTKCSYLRGEVERLDYSFGWALGNESRAHVRRCQRVAGDLLGSNADRCGRILFSLRQGKSNSIVLPAPAARARRLFEERRVYDIVTVSCARRAEGNKKKPGA